MVYLTELILGTGLCWEVVRYLSPWQIPVRFAPAMVAAIAFGLYHVHISGVLIALASAGGVAIFHKITDASEKAPEPLSLSVPRIKRRESSIPPSRRIPGL